jgi:hypothetical protein
MSRGAHERLKAFYFFSNLWNIPAPEHTAFAHLRSLTERFYWFPVGRFAIISRIRLFYYISG